MAAWPFILCMEQAEGNPASGESCYTSTMNTTALPWSTVKACSTDEADYVQTAAMKATPTHDYVPWALVDDVLLERTNLLQKTICDAYTGKIPPYLTLIRLPHKPPSQTNKQIIIINNNNK